MINWKECLSVFDDKANFIYVVEKESWEEIHYTKSKTLQLSRIRPMLNPQKKNITYKTDV